MFTVVDRAASSVVKINESIKIDNNSPAYIVSKINHITSKINALIEEKHEYLKKYYFPLFKSDIEERFFQYFLSNPNTSFSLCTLAQLYPSPFINPHTKNWSSTLKTKLDNLVKANLIEEISPTNYKLHVHFENL